MTLNIFCIPSMSFESKRVFSSTKHMIIEKRATLHPNTIEWLECVKNWMRAGIYIDIELIVMLTLLTQVKKEGDEL